MQREATYCNSSFIPNSVRVVCGILSFSVKFSQEFSVQVFDESSTYTLLVAL